MIPLTEAETEVLKLRGLGGSLKQIARLRYVSESTLKAQLAKTYKKLGALNSAHAVYIACKRGLI